MGPESVPLDGIAVDNVFGFCDIEWILFVYLGMNGELDLAFRGSIQVKENAAANCGNAKCHSDLQLIQRHMNGSKPEDLGRKNQGE